MTKTPNLCKTCGVELVNPKHTHCRECFIELRDNMAQREEDIIKGLYDLEPDRGEWV